MPCFRSKSVRRMVQKQEGGFLSRQAGGNLAIFFLRFLRLSLFQTKNLSLSCLYRTTRVNQRTNELNIFFPLFLFSSNQRIKNSAVFENLRARLDGVPVRALRGDSQKARFEDVFVLGDPVRGLSKSTHEPRESEREREPRVFLPEGGKLSVRARHFRELVTSESVSHAVV